MIHLAALPAALNAFGVTLMEVEMESSLGQRDRRL